MGNILLFLLGMRDNLGIIVADTPFRFGEIMMLIFCFFVLIRHMITRFSKDLYLMTILMSLHLIFSILSVFLNHSYDVSYIIKYISRNILIILFFIAVNHLNVNRLEFNFEKCMKYMIIVYSMCFVFELAGYSLWMCQIIDYSGHGFMGINRFSGTASEPGYFLEPIILPLYYYYKKKNLKMLTISCVLACLTFSVGVYAGILVAFLIDKISIIGNKKNIIRQREVISGLLVMLSIVLIFLVILYSNKTYVINELYEKGLAYLKGSETTEYSTMVRNQIKNIAIENIMNFTPKEWIFGKGLGGFFDCSKQLWKDGKLFHYGESPDNVYLGVLFDTGILGLGTYIMTLIVALKQKPKSIEAKTLYCALIVSLFHNFILSGMWLYSIWVEIGLLFIINRKDNMLCSDITKRKDIVC